MQRLEDMGKFKTVVIDPPWGIVQRPSTAGYLSLAYQTMTIEEIGNMPLSKALDDDAWLFIWTTQAFLPSAITLLTTWDVQYKLTMTWHKEGGPQPLGLPAYNSEFVVVGKRGNPQFLDTKAFKTANFWKRGAHSEKPEGFYDLLRRVTPSPRLDIFGRRRIAGFHSWGNEAPEQSEILPDHYQMVM